MFSTEPGFISSVFVGSLDASAVYDGANDRRMLNRWYNLTSSPKTIPKIPNLAWTDIVANMVVGTKSVSPNHKQLVQTHVRKVTYDFKYGIPALLCLLVWTTYALLSLGMLIKSSTRARVVPDSIRRMINALSVGRALVLLPNTETDELYLGTKEWLGLNGSVDIELDSRRKESAGDSEAVEEIRVTK